MNDTVSGFRGETLRLKLTMWEGVRDVSARRDLSGATLSDVSVGSSFPSPALSLLDAVQGEVQLLWTGAQTATMAPGRVHRFRLGVAFPGGDSEVVGDIWINLR